VNQPIPGPVEGKFIFQVENNMRIRFNADGWVEELGAGGAEDSIGTRLQGKAGTARDDLYARRFYDLYSRVMLLDVHSRVTGAAQGVDGVVSFRDLEPNSRIYERLNRIIEIGNHHFNMNVTPLGA
jgi:hypothetical protein